jgi:hypothetical protein
MSVFAGEVARDLLRRPLLGELLTHQRPQRFTAADLLLLGAVAPQQGLVVVNKMKTWRGIATCYRLGPATA